MIKYLIKEYRRRRILRDIKNAKRCYQISDAEFMCIAFKRINIKYRNKPINSIIPEFDRKFLNAEYKDSSVWWPYQDRESRIKAFDKLIEVYSKRSQRRINKSKDNK